MLQLVTDIQKSSSSTDDHEKGFIGDISKFEKVMFCLSCCAVASMSLCHKSNDSAIRMTSEE